MSEKNLLDASGSVSVLLEKLEAGLRRLTVTAVLPDALLENVHVVNAEPKPGMTTAQRFAAAEELIKRLTVQAGEIIELKKKIAEGEEELYRVRLEKDFLGAQVDEILGKGGQ